jgi:hypothetical protein
LAPFATEPTGRLRAETKLGGEVLVTHPTQSGHWAGPASEAELVCARGGRLPRSAGDEIILADDEVTVMQQVNQQLEHLWFDGNGLEAAAQLACVGIKCMIGKEKSHVLAAEPGSEAALKE